MLNNHTCLSACSRPAQGTRSRHEGRGYPFNIVAEFEVRTSQGFSKSDTSKVQFRNFSSSSSCKTMSSAGLGLPPIPSCANSSNGAGSPARHFHTSWLMWLAFSRDLRHAEPLSHVCFVGELLRNLPLSPKHKVSSMHSLLRLTREFVVDALHPDCRFFCKHAPMHSGDILRVYRRTSSTKRLARKHPGTSARTFERFRSPDHLSCLP